MTGADAPDTPEVLWTPDLEHHGRLAEFTDWVRDHRGVDAPDYAALHTWSVEDQPGFWSAIAEFLDVRFHEQPAAVLGRVEMPGAEWFPGATLNYAEQALAVGGDDQLALVFA